MSEESIQQKCTQCGKAIETNWFARLHEADGWQVFCSPKCLLAHIQIDPTVPWNDTGMIPNADTFLNSPSG